MPVLYDGDKKMSIIDIIKFYEETGFYFYDSSQGNPPVVLNRRARVIGIDKEEKIREIKELYKKYKKNYFKK